MSQAHYDCRDGIAVISMDNPPVNGLGHGLRTGIVESLARANADDTVSAIVLTGLGRAFSGGADIREFGTPLSLAAPRLTTVIDHVEGSAKPVVAAVHSVAMGGGLELALGCHYRVAAKGAQIALPEVKLGILPGAGGTQRLPRVIPLEMATNMIVSGEPVKSEKFADTALFDQIVDGDVVDAAVALARQVVAEGSKKPRVRDMAVAHEDAEAFLQFSLNTVRAMTPHMPAPAKCIEAIRGAVKLPFDQGMAAERAGFMSLVSTPESAALRHAFFAERAATKIPDVPKDTPLREIASVAVIGAGLMGTGIAMNFLNAGMPVRILEREQSALDKGVATIRKNYERTASRGRISADDVEKRMALLTPVLEYQALADADLVIEAVFEEIEVKKAVFETLDATMKSGAILASNTSTLDVDKIAAFTKRPGDVIGMHFFSPANVMKLLEVVRGAATEKDVLATVMKLAKKIRKTAVVSGVCDGFIGNRMIEQYSRQATFMLEEGATPAQVDRAVEKLGFAMGPFRMGDLAGNDIGWAIRQRRYVEQPDIIYCGVEDRLCEAGRFGQKTGAGWYRYEAGNRKALPDPAVIEIIEKHRADKGITPRAISDDEIVHRLMFALVNEGAHILEEGIALRASDIDLIYLSGYGFPLHLGGPMLYADQYGLYNVVGKMAEFAANPGGDPAFWQPAPLLAKLAASNESFN
jgi:3-hydroxyacyl-CoA dehydrogenase